MSRTDAVDAVDAVQALGIPSSRFEIIRQLRDHRLSVTQLMERTGLCRSAINNHLRLLTGASIVSRKVIVSSHSAKPVAYYRLDEMRLLDELRRIAEGS